MIHLRCFAELPALNPETGNGWEDRAQYETDAVLALAARGELDFTENCRYVLQELAGMEFDPATGYVSEPGSLIAHRLCDQGPDTREALAIVLMWEAHGAWQAFTVNDTLKNPLVLRVLCALRRGNEDLS